MRYRFDEIFHENDNGTLTPIHNIRVGAVMFNNKTIIGPGVVVGGIDFNEFRGRDIEATEQEDTIVIKGIY